MFSYLQVHVQVYIHTYIHTHSYIIFMHVHMFAHAMFCLTFSFHTKTTDVLPSKVHGSDTTGGSLQYLQPNSRCRSKLLGEDHLRSAKMHRKSVHIYLHIYVHVFFNIYVYTCILYVYIYILCVYIYIYIYSLSQWLNFKLSGITCLVGKLKFTLLSEYIYIYVFLYMCILYIYILHLPPPPSRNSGK